MCKICNRHRACAIINTGKAAIEACTGCFQAYIYRQSSKIVVSIEDQLNAILGRMIHNRNDFDWALRMGEQARLLRIL